MKNDLNLYDKVLILSNLVYAARGKKGQIVGHNPGILGGPETWVVALDTDGTRLAFYTQELRKVKEDK